MKERKKVVRVRDWIGVHASEIPMGRALSVVVMAMRGRCQCGFAMAEMA